MNLQLEPGAFRDDVIDVGGQDIAFTVGGQGPPVLLLHGFPQTRALWRRVVPHLAARFTVVCADLRGYGASGKPKCLADASNYAFREMARDQVALMERLGFSEFKVVGHDRGGRVAHRMALDWPERVLALAALDIVPTLAMFAAADHRVFQAYWHWMFLAQPDPFPEHLIGADPDFFYEACLTGWGSMRLADFDPAALADYRAAWRDPAAIHGSCSDYRAAASVDLSHDQADQTVLVACPTLAFWGSQGAMARLFDIGAEWGARCADLTTATLPGGHFFIDQFPEQTAEVLDRFLRA